MNKSDEKLKCCVCNSHANSRSFRQVDGYDLMKCHQCSLVYLKYSPENNHNFIQDSNEGKVEYWSAPKFFDRHEDVFKKYFQQRLKRMKSFYPPNGPILDVGVGYGFWAQYLIKQGYEVEGIDISKEALEHAVSYFGVKATKQSFEEFETNRKYSAIFMFDVLEHLDSPGLMIQKAKKLLLPGGILYIQVPNVLGVRYPFNHNLGLPHHLWQFNPSSLLTLLSQSGFGSNRQYWTGIQGVIGVHEKGGPSLVTQILWNLANKLRIGNRLQVVSQKCDSTPQ